ncbi:hypothetical protein WJX75_002451 [Coccomyxa subellipsoidea]|uniref:NmrA-like domain-containing protein n=1 Tax=Coccomyxa subellipsoidea TaxID=248742 RepID=A0ABR2Z2U6_9CHLO
MAPNTICREAAGPPVVLVTGAAGLRATGAEVIVGDLLSQRDVQRAVQGVDYIYFSFAVQQGLMEASTIAAVAAAEAGVIGIINNSQWCADMFSLSPTSRRHALAEAVFDAFPTPTVHLRGAVYNINIIKQLGPRVASSGLLSAPNMSGADTLPLISGYDVAATANAVLQNFSAYSGQAVLLVSQLRSLDIIAKEFSAVFNRQVLVETIDADAWEGNLAKSLPGLNATGVEHLRALWEIMREGSHDSDLMAKLGTAQARLGTILGRKPLTFEEDLSSYIQAQAKR